jgi:hypothetical protein
MTQKRDLTAPKMTRVTVRVPRTTLDQTNDWVDALGVRRSHFLGIALVAGVRSLMRASALEMSLPPESPTQPGIGPRADEPMPQGATSGGMDPDVLTQMVATLTSEVASLRAEVAGLREQLDTQQGGKKRS